MDPSFIKGKNYVKNSDEAIETIKNNLFDPELPLPYGLELQLRFCSLRISVLKKVETSLPEVAVQSAGPRFNAQGEILPYTILGSVEHYKNSMLATGNEVC